MEGFTTFTTSAPLIILMGQKTGGYDEPPVEFYEAFPILDQETVCPGCGEDIYTVGDIIINLNDAYGWTREQIADWLDDLEEQGFDQTAKIKE